MRRRMINPDFFTDEDVVENLDFAGRLFYAGLWCVAEDSGCFEPAPMQLKMKIFPGDSIETTRIKEYLTVLAENEKLVYYEIGGKEYAWLCNFWKHQRLDRPTPPKLPTPEWVIFLDHDDEGKALPRHLCRYDYRKEPERRGLVDDKSTTSRRQDDDPSNLREGKGIEVKGKEVKRKEVKEESPATATTEEREILNVLKSVPGYPIDYEKDLDMIRTFAIDYPGLNLLPEFKKWKDYKRDKPLQKNSSPRSQLRNWMEKAVEFRKPRSNSGGDQAGSYREFVR
jgi:hypothetical protein